MALTLDELRSAFKKDKQAGNGRPNNYYPFWNMKDGEQAVIRFLPDKNTSNPLGFMVEKLTHNLVISGEKKTIPCVKMHGDDCPICKVSSGYYKNEDKENGKKYWRSKQHIAQVLVVEDPLEPNKDTGENHQGKVRFIAFGFQLFNVIKEAFESGDLEENPTSYENGYNFVIKKSKQGNYSSYSVGSRFKAKPVSLTPDEVEMIEENMVDLATLLPPHPGLEKVESMLNAALTGAVYNADAAAAADDAQPEDEPVAKVTTKAKAPVVAEDEEEVPPPRKTTGKAKTEVPAASGDTGTQAEAILAAIAARRASKA